MHTARVFSSSRYLLVRACSAFKARNGISLKTDYENVRLEIDTCGSFVWIWWKFKAEIITMITLWEIKSCGCHLNLTIGGAVYGRTSLSEPNFIHGINQANKLKRYSKQCSSGPPSVNMSTNLFVNNNSCWRRRRTFLDGIKNEWFRIE